MYLVTVEIQFEYGHRLIKHQGKCRNVHGHNGLAVIQIESDVLKEDDLVIDFSEVKRFAKDWIDANWDHAFLMNSKDQLGKVLLDFDESLRIFYFENSDPTAERMAEYLYNVLREHLPTDVNIRAVTVYETQRASATYMENNFPPDFA